MSEKFYPPEPRDPTVPQAPTPPPEASSEDFDALLRSALPELPPQDVVREVTPLGGTVKLITWGLTLCSVTLNLPRGEPFIMRTFMPAPFRVCNKIYDYIVYRIFG